MNKRGKNIRWGRVTNRKEGGRKERFERGAGDREEGRLGGRGRGKGGLNKKREEEEGKGAGV